MYRMAGLVSVTALTVASHIRMIDNSISMTDGAGAEAEEGTDLVVWFQTE
jgi:hypothetical protein